MSESNEDVQITQEAIDKLYKKLDREARASGYNLNPDVEFTKRMHHGLVLTAARH